MPKLSRLAVAVVALVVAAAPLQAQVTASTFGPGNSFTPSNGYFVSNGGGELFASVANPFTASLSGALAGVRVATYTLGSPAAASLHVGLYQGTDMNTATLLEEFLGSSSNGAGTIQSFASVLHPVISAGGAYFVALFTDDPDGAYVWNLNDQGFLADMSFRGKPTDMWTPNGSPIDAAAFDVSVAVTATPEPATLALLGGGVLALGGVVRVRRRR